MIDKEVLDTLEKLFGITFTENETRILTASKDQLGPYDRQRQFILRMALERTTCPACGYIICRRSAVIGDFNTDSSGADKDYECPNCVVPLLYHLGMIAGEQWFTLDTSKVEVTRKG